MTYMLLGHIAAYSFVNFERYFYGKSYGIHRPQALCSTLVIRPSINSAESYFFLKIVLSHVFVHNLMIYYRFLLIYGHFEKRKI